MRTPHLNPLPFFEGRGDESHCLTSVLILRDLQRMSLAAKRNISDFSPGIVGRFNQRFFSRDCGIRMTILSNEKSGLKRLEKAWRALSISLKTAVNDRIRSEIATRCGRSR